MNGEKVTWLILGGLFIIIGLTIPGAFLLAIIGVVFIGLALCWVN